MKKSIKHIVVANIIFFALLLASNCFAADTLPKTVNGVLDLSKWDWETNGEILLKGQWKFFDKQLLEPKDIAESNRFIYKNVSNNSGNLDFDGYGTYALEIKVSDINDSLRLSFDNSYVTNYMLWINGALEHSFGVPEPETLKENMIERKNDVLRKTSLCVKANNQLITIVLQLSSDNSNRFSGFLLETNTEYNSKYTSSPASLYIIITSLLLMGLYHIVLFIFRKKDPTTLYFGLTCICILIFYIFNDWIFYYNTLGLPDITSIPLYKFIYILYICTTFLAMEVSSLYILLSFKKQASEKLVRTFNFILIPIAFLLSIFSTIYDYFGVITWVIRNTYAILLALYAIIIIIKAVKDKVIGAKYICWGLIIIAITEIIDSFNALLAIEKLEFQTLGWGMLAFIFSNALAIANKFSIAFQNVETLAERLQSLTN